MESIIKPRKDISGQKFNHLTAVKPAGGKYWIFKCDCGNETKKSRQAVVSGAVKSCGCQWRKPNARIDITGHRYGRLLVVEYLKGAGKWRCVCDCGNETTRKHKDLINAETPSCGCYLKEGIRRKHGLSDSSIYRIWWGIKRRCNNPNEPAFANYGGRGIGICERWNFSFEDFLADMGERPSKKHSIDRIDVNGDYCPENCRWATSKEQANNTRYNIRLSHNGETHTISEWCDIFNFNYKKAIRRYEHGYGFNEIFCNESLVSKRRKFTDDEIRLIRSCEGGFSECNRIFKGRLTCGTYHQIINKETYQDVI